MVRTLTLLLATAVLASCGAKTTATTELGDLSYSTYSTCQTSADERQSPAGGGVVNSGYFGKLIDRSDLNSILPTNIQQTAAHASNERLAVFVVAQGQCSTFSFLPYAPTHLYEYWKEAAGATGVSSLLGLYKEDCGGGCNPNEVINPIVMLNACTDRWTMVHEFVHHNFNVQRKKYKPFDSDEAIIAVLMNELNVLQATVDGYNRAPDEYQGMRLAHSLDRVRDLLTRFTYQTSFEEVSIESMLMREFGYNRLRNVPSSAIRNAISYVRFSTSAGVDRLAPIRTAAEDLALSARENGWDRVASNALVVKSKIDNFEDDSMCYQNEAVELYRRATIAAQPVEPQIPEGEVTEWSHRFKENDLAVAAHVDSHTDPRATQLSERLENLLSTLKPK